MALEVYLYHKNVHSISDWLGIPVPLANLTSSSSTANYDTDQLTTFLSLIDGIKREFDLVLLFTIHV